MKSNPWIYALLAATALAGCHHQQPAAAALQAKAAGSALVVSSGDRQTGVIGSQLPQPLVLQVNDSQGNAVTGAKVAISGPAGVVFDSTQVLTDDNGLATFKVQLGGSSGRYELTATSQDAQGKPFTLSVVELAVGYPQEVGREVNDKYCSRCHNPDSSAEQVSNYDNLAVKPHAFTSGDVYNKFSDVDLTNIITHGGPSLNRSALMPPYGNTLSKSEIKAVISYIRLVSDPPYVAPGVAYDKR